MRIGFRNNLNDVVASFGRRISESRAAIERGLKKSRPATDQALRTEAHASFKIRDPRADRMWRVGVPSGTLTLRITNLMRGFELHVTGGTIAPKRGSALLIPINTYLGGRIGTARFYKLVDWLRREKLTFIRGNILYVRVPMNTSKRGGVGVGTHVQKKFRAKMQGTLKRPSGFGLNVNAEGLTPIAVLRRSISLHARFNVDSVTNSRVIPIILENVRQEMISQQ